MNKLSGGPAFPTTVHPNSQDGHDGMMTGMTLRDWFAGQAMAAIIAGNNADASAMTTGAAKDAYAVADAMLAERSMQGVGK